METNRNREDGAAYQVSRDAGIRMPGAGYQGETAAAHRKAELLKAYQLGEEDAEAYQERAYSGEFMSSHLLADFRESPQLYYRKTHGIIPRADTAALQFGRAAHTLILEGETSFRTAYRIADGPINPRTGEAYGRQTKAYTEWASGQRLPCCSHRDYELLQRLKDSVAAHPFARTLFGEGVSEGVGRAEVCGVPCQIRPDWIHPEHGIVDLKTCESLAHFESDVRRYGYVHQMAFYRAVYRALAGRECATYLVAVEKAEPYSTGVWLVMPELLKKAEEDNAQALVMYGACRVSDVWPTGYEQVRYLAPKAQ